MNRAYQDAANSYLRYCRIQDPNFGASQAPLVDRVIDPSSVDRIVKQLRRNGNGKPTPTEQFDIEACLTALFLGAGMCYSDEGHATDEQARLQQIAREMVNYVSPIDPMYAYSFVNFCCEDLALDHPSLRHIRDDARNNGKSGISKTMLRRFKKVAKWESR